MWLKKEEEPHWRVIINALEKMKSYELAEELRDLHLGEDESQSTTSVCNDNSTSVNPPSILVEEHVVNDFSCLESKFAKLVTDVKFTLKDKQVYLEQLHSYIKTRLDIENFPAPKTPDELIGTVVQSYYSFLNISLIENIIDEFLDGSPVQVSLQIYKRELNIFKRSTKMKELIDTVTTSLQKEKGTAVVVLKLEGVGWM